MVSSSSSPRRHQQRQREEEEEEEPENIDSVERLEKHNASYVGQSTDDGYKNDRFGPDEIDVLVEALRIDKEEKERSEKCYFRREFPRQRSAPLRDENIDKIGRSRPRRTLSVFETNARVR